MPPPMPCPPPDPFEPINRSIFAFNKAVDTVIIKPFGTLYHDLVPKPIANSVTNFFRNLNELPTIANDLLQGNFCLAYADSWRLIINTTFGIVGLFDIATLAGIPPHSTDFGITLARWGIVNTPYLVLPILGPSTFSDALAIPVDYYAFTVYSRIHPLRDRYSLLALYIVNFRANIIDVQGLITQVTLDPYVFERDAYLQRRQHMLEESINATWTVN